ncbi:MAG: TetR/AcrR family transcriptional regulator [Candidatus Theseobacter exili]|nr:TetR/AcrR family transcriptional regulator [Candidatus Theseobacter exili]
MPRIAVKKAMIEDSAIYLFSTKGLPLTTVRDIAEHANVAEGALYRHYSGKNDMAWKLFNREVEIFSEKLKPILFDGSLEFTDRVENGVRFMYKYYKNRPNVFAFILLTQHGFPEEKLLDNEKNPNDILAKFVKMSMDEGFIRKCNEIVLSGILMGAILQPVIMHWYGRIKTPPMKIANEVIDVCLRMVQKNS